MGTQEKRSGNGDQQRWIKGEAIGTQGKGSGNGDQKRWIQGGAVGALEKGSGNGRFLEDLGRSWWTFCINLIEGWGPCVVMFGSKVGAETMGKYRKWYWEWSKMEPTGTKRVLKMSQRATHHSFLETTWAQLGLSQGQSARCFSRFSAQSHKPLFFVIVILP